MPNDAIAAGLSVIERRTQDFADVESGPPPNFPTEVLSPAEIGIGAAEAEQHADAFENIAKQLDASIGQAEQAARDDAMRFKDVLGPKASNIGAQKAEAARREVLKNSDTIRRDALQKIARLSERLSAQRTLYASPDAILARDGLSPEGLQFAQRLARSGPAELRNFVNYSVALAKTEPNKARALGSAILARLDALRPQDRESVGVHRKHIAEALAGPVFREVSEKLKRADMALQRAVIRNRILENPRAGGIDNVAYGIAAGQYER